MDDVRSSLIDHERPQQKLRLKSWKPVVRGTLRGFATIETSLMTVHDCPVHWHPNGRAWVSLPGRAQIDQDGRQRVDANGKKLFVPVLEWRSREISERFSDAVIEALREAGISFGGGVP
jgi:hypothetical protein